jgi:hypothetical protein
LTRASDIDITNGAIMTKVTRLALFLLFVSLLPASALAQQTLDGSIYMVQGTPVDTFFNFSVSGQTFVATILTFGNGGNGRWFAAFGTTDGASGTAQILMPAGFTISQPAGATLSFQLDQPDAPTGSFATKGLEAFLPLTSGRMVRIFP